ncbi:hypothetical protein DACRYDRAFT_101348 [Dacryopinax primogenitus]|uniref:Uncharacterized protein n=1 Tax=Dacryopinax primogenitus (strain DJM 731) TaxID=1858805 RepID=M5FUK9_DACPD|nr:uncharacterized protein DACRYDRAFT_101348 [Dacryopinax primogenitus]EJT99159.1 hypothetical protein DACRYDRAFT_101348 [Dacryopinax primogenitus]
MSTLDPYPMLPQPQKRLTARRSSAAQDPFNRLQLTPADSVSRLTIVRVPQPDDAPSRPGSVLGSRPGSAASNRDSPRELNRVSSEKRHERALSSESDRVRRSSWGSAASESRRTPFSPFTPIHPDRPTGTPGSGTGFAGSFSRSRAQTSAPAPRLTTQTLTPKQTVDLALSLNNPTSEETATIAELGEADYLPFLDRCAEVQQLVTSPGPTSDLFKLLRKTFPSSSPNTPLLPLPDPAKWTYDQLIYHLTRVPRSSSPDADWSRLLRLCIRSHSEALWERVKGALGIPPELEVEDERDDPSQSWEIYDFGPGADADADPALLFDEDEYEAEPFEARLEPVYHGGSSPLLSPTLEAALSPNLNALSSSMSGLMPDLAELREEEEDEASDRASGRSSPVGSTKSGESAGSRHIHGLRITTAASISSSHASTAGTPPSVTPAGSVGGSAGAGWSPGTGLAAAGLSRAFSTGSMRGFGRLKMTPLEPAEPRGAGGPSVPGGVGEGRPRGATVNVGSLPGGRTEGVLGRSVPSQSHHVQPMSRQQQPQGAYDLASPLVSPLSSPLNTSNSNALNASLTSNSNTHTSSPDPNLVHRGSSERSHVYHPLAERGPGNPLFPSSFSRLSIRPTLSANENKAAHLPGPRD